MPIPRKTELKSHTPNKDKTSILEKNINHPLTEDSEDKEKKPCEVNGVKEKNFEEMTNIEKIEHALKSSKDMNARYQKFDDDFEETLESLVEALGVQMGSPLYLEDPEEVSEQDRLEVLGGNPTLEQISVGLKSGRYKNVIVMTGAGMSTAAGIPDFRSPGKGLYATLKNSFPELNQPEDIFNLSYFRMNPKPFCKLCRELNLCGGGDVKYRPTKAHYLSLLLSKKKILKRVYTQNIDGLDLTAGISPKLLVQSHGGGRSARCIECHKAQDIKKFRKFINKGGVPKCTECSGLCKPDITFFGENLPKRFHENKERDFGECDLLIIMGTTLQVAPFCTLVADVSKLTPRLLINMADLPNERFLFKHKKNYRDVFEKDTCDSVVQRLVNLCGWKPEFQKLLKSKE